MKNRPINFVDNKKPVIIALHGFLASSSYWRRLHPYLDAADYQVITIDLLGFGSAEKPDDSPYDYTAHISHIRKTIQKYSSRQPVILLGHSMGALLAARYATLYPKEIASTILLHPPLYTSPEQVRRTLRIRNYYRFLLDSRLRGAAWGVLRNIPFLMISRHTKKSREHSLKNIIESAELFDDLAKITVPTLLVNGTRDRSIYAQNLHMASLSGCINVSHQHTAHHSPLLQPIQTGDKIISYLAAM